MTKGLVYENEEGGINKDMEAIKGYLKEVIHNVGNSSQNQSPDQDLNELSVIIPKEIDKV